MPGTTLLRCTGSLEPLPTILATSALLVCGAVQGSGWQMVKSNELPADTLIVLQRGACEHRCAVYKVIIFADGTAIFDGRHYVRQPTVIRTSIGLDSLGKLLEKAAVVRFFEMKERYAPDASNGCDSVKSDAPTAIVSVSSGSRSKTIVHYIGCAGRESEELSQFEEEIDRAVNTVRWVK